jgi:hypothetical protein
MADSGKPSAEAYNASSVAGENTHEGALRGTCPDDGRCHHSCLTQGPCFRELDAGFSDTGWDHGPAYIQEEIAAPPLTRPARLPLDVVAVPPGFCACCPRCGRQLTEACQSGSGPDHFAEAARG